MRPRLSLIAIAIGAAALVAGLATGCGSSSSSSTTGAAASGPNYQGSGTASSAASTSGGPATVSVANNSDLGPILVDAKGRTLYLFKKDESDESYCNGSCAKVWPPLTTNGAPKALSGVAASKLDTLKRDDGTTQVIFDGHPLYKYVDDKASCDT